MDYFLQDSAHVTNSLSLNEPAGSTLKDKLTYKRWARRMLAFYACLFFAGATAIGLRQILASSNGTGQHASLRTDIRPNH
jgi:hypothetical protein